MRTRQKMRKGMIGVIMAVTIALCLAACGGSGESAAVGSETFAADVSGSNYKDNISSPSETITVPTETETIAAPTGTETSVAPTQPAPPVDEPQPEPTTLPPETAATEAPPALDNNVFSNPTNNGIDLNTVSVKPGYVYYDGSVLVAQCFVINGFDHPVNNISVDELTLSNAQGVVADAAFGVIGGGGSIGAMSYVTWEFRFDPANCTVVQGADLASGLYCSASTSYNY